MPHTAADAASAAELAYRVDDLLVDVGRAQVSRAGTRDRGQDDRVEGRTARPVAGGRVPTANSTGPRSSKIFPVRWDAAGYATLPTTGSPLRDAAIGLVDVLRASGEQARGQRLLGAILARMKHEIGDLGRSEFWYYRWHPTALALNGERDAALAMMERSIASGLGPGDWWYYYESEPALAPLRQDARFKAMLRTVQGRVEMQRRELERMRAEKIVPDRR